MATTFFNTFFRLLPIFPSTRAVAAEWQRSIIHQINRYTYMRLYKLTENRPTNLTEGELYLL